MRVTQNVLLILLAVTFKDSSSACLDKFALSSVDALVHKQRNSRAIFHRKENFNVLDDYISVDVIRSNVSQLCEGMVKNFPVLETLSLINANLTLIEPGTFQNVPNLKYLSLSVNQLVNIKRGVFDTIKSLKAIYLTNNQIETIDDGAFAEMANLKAIHLDHNKISQLSGNIFFGSPVISLVDFSYNQLTTIQETAFADLRPSSSVKALNILLRKNKIETIDKGVFEPINSPVILHLESNEISRISDLVSSVKEKSHIYLANNKVQCVADDILELIKATDIKVDIKNNPVQCECVERADKILSIDFKGELNIVTSLPCQVNFPFFGNQL